MFFIAYAGIGYLQINSSGELSEALKDMKQESKDNIVTFKTELNNTLPRYEQRIDRLTDEVNYKVDNKMEEMTIKLNEILGSVPKLQN